MTNEEEKHFEGYGDDFTARWGEDFMEAITEEFGAAKDLVPVAFKGEEGVELVRLRNDPDHDRIGIKYLL